MILKPSPKEFRLKIQIDPKPLPRHKVPRFGKPYLPPSYNEYKNIIVTTTKNKYNYELFNEAIGASIDFYMPIPKSYSNKKRSEMVGTPHILNKDLDNLIKGIFDALNGIVYTDDRLIYSVSSDKIWSLEGSIEIYFYTFKEVDKCQC